MTRPPGRRSRRTRGRQGGVVRIRRADLSDTGVICRVMRASIRTLARGLYAPGEIAAWSSLPPLYHAWAMTAGGERYLVAEEGHRVVGYAAWRGREITALFVVPSRARTGVGTALLERVERDARRGGGRALFARAALSGAPFYLARGFAGVRRVRVPLPGGDALAAVLLHKRLEAPLPGDRSPRGRGAAARGSGG